MSRVIDALRVLLYGLQHVALTKRPMPVEVVKPIPADPKRPIAVTVVGPVETRGSPEGAPTDLIERARASRMKLARTLDANHFTGAIGEEFLKRHPRSPGRRHAR